MAAWTFLVADLRTNVILGEIPIAGVRMSKTLNGSGQMQGTFNLGDAKVQARNIYDMTRPARRAIYAIRDNEPWWGGIIWASSYDSETATVTINLTPRDGAAHTAGCRHS